MSGENRWNSLEGRVITCAAGGKKTRTVQPYPEDFLRLLLHAENEDGSERSREDRGRG